MSHSWIFVQIPTHLNIFDWIVPHCFEISHLIQTKFSLNVGTSFWILFLYVFVHFFLNPAQTYMALPHAFANYFIYGSIYFFSKILFSLFLCVFSSIFLFQENPSITIKFWLVSQSFGKNRQCCIMESSHTGICYISLSWFSLRFCYTFMLLQIKIIACSGEPDVWAKMGHFVLTHRLYKPFFD